MIASASLIILAAITLLISGIARVVQWVSKEIPKLSRAGTIGVGILSIVISLFITANPIRIGLALLAIMLTTTLLISGIKMIFGSKEY